MFDYFTDPNNNIWLDLLDVTVRSLVSIIVLFLLAKALGNKQIKQLSFFDYVVGISIGSIAAAMTTSNDFPHHFFIVAMVIYTLVSLLVGTLALKTNKVRRFLEGVPIVLIDNGKIIYKNLKKSQMTVNSLLAECRYEGYFDISDIDTAILETSGEISILPKSNAKKVTAEDLNLHLEQEKPCANVVIDSEIMVNNLKSINKTDSWLRDKLKEKKIELKDILLATLNNKGELLIYTRNVEPQQYDMFE